MRRKKQRVGKRTLEIAFSILMIGLVVFAVHGWLSQQRPDENTSSRKAALIDQLSIDYPNPAFQDEFIKILKDAGYTSDVYDGSQVNIDFYRTLPSMEYQLILFRVHQSTPVEYLLPNSRPVTGSPVYLFTGEPYDERRYVVEQLSDLVVPAREINGSKIYFAIGPQFVQSMSGNFPSTVIILAGCSGLYSADLADSFIIKGASVVIGWQRFVQMDYTDKAMLRFLKAMLLERNTIFRSVMTMTSDVGLDPTYKTNLLCYPEERIGLTFSQAIELKEKVIVSQQAGVRFESCDLPSIDPKSLPDTGQVPIFRSTPRSPFA